MGLARDDAASSRRLIGPKGESTMNRLVRRIVLDRKGDATAGWPPEEERDDALDYFQVGERVAAVLEFAKRVAEDTLAQARREADLVLAEVENVATATVTEAARKAQEVRHETEQLRAEATRYSTETREAADAYAAETRGGAEKAAAKAISEAEERVKRRMAIVAEAARFEDRLQNLVTVFRGMTDQLEDLLAERQAQMEGDVPAGETLQESLEEPIKGERTKHPST